MINLLLVYIFAGMLELAFAMLIGADRKRGPTYWRGRLRAFAWWPKQLRHDIEYLYYKRKHKRLIAELVAMTRKEKQLAWEMRKRKYRK